MVHPYASSVLSVKKNLSVVVWIGLVRAEARPSHRAVGPITALTWALEVGEVERFSSIKKAISYCGLCSAEKNSGDTARRTSRSKQRGGAASKRFSDSRERKPQRRAGLRNTQEVFLSTLPARSCRKATG